MPLETPIWQLAKKPQYQIEIQYPYRSIMQDRREAASHISVLSIIPHPYSSSENPVDNLMIND